MIVYGYAKETKYNNDGILEIKVRIPQIHGPYLQTDAKGKTIHNYVRDQDLPYYQAVLSNPSIVVSDGDVVMLQSEDDAQSSELIVIGVTGSNYYSNMTE